MTDAPPPRLLLDYPEAAHVLNVGRTTVYKLVGGGELTAVKIGKRTLITVSSVQDFVDRLAAQVDVPGARSGAVDLR